MFVQTVLRRRRPTDTFDSSEQQRLSARIEQLEAELWAQRNEQAAALEEVNERIDFAERLLTQQGPSLHFPVREATPV
jgi:hypothetical protein